MMMGMEQTSSPQPSKSYGSAYGKRPLWQWILLYLVIGGIIYALVYYFVLAKRNGGTYTYDYNSQYQTTPLPSTTDQTTTGETMPGQAMTGPTASSSSLLMTKSNTAKGSYLADNKGMTLYIFDVDKPGISN